MDYNCTQLDPKTNFERHVYHRDQFAHYLRWTHVLKRLKIGQKVLDVGFANSNLLEVMYRNRYKGSRYVGLEYRKQTVKKNQEKYEKLDWAELYQHDVTTPFQVKDDWDLICSFEVLEHVQIPNVEPVLQNMKDQMSEKTILLISTPVYDPKVGAADNHIINGEICEMTYDELKEKIENVGLKIKNVWGTFASQRDYKPLMNDWQKEFFNAVKDYFDSNILSTLMAPFFPEQSRNCMWELSI
jgi:2-polyprenyl-3-methyl-5-hydroxy-6-metoxy-1,4-benzoquinol methylase